MIIFKLLVLLMAFSAALGLRCYTCTATDPKSCTDTKACSSIFNRCFSLRVDSVNVVTKGCQTSAWCVSPMSCCEGDLCNGSIKPGSSFVLMFLTSATFLLFL